ncbi:MAG: type II toxin-antitoxin system VapC family toxin [SAR202 cluster bacterium]|nr:type II toxin-antitoxin system VapC family toxin [SAR202 cluster bacterium]
MLYMLDTDICVFILRNSSASVSEAARRVPASDLCISVVTLAELLFGAERSDSKRFNQAIVRGFADRIQIHPWDQSAAESYAVIRNQVQRAGLPAAAMDLMIASHAVSKGATIVTNNVRHFHRIQGLKIENWARPA